GMGKKSNVKRAIISVTNDLVTDRRIDKTSLALIKAGFSVAMVGRRKRDSLPLEEREYYTKRMFLFFEKGPLFYMEYTIRLFFYLLFHKSDLLVSNDLDTLLPSYLVSRLKKKPLIYDTHEYYTGVPELVNRPFVRHFWKRIEKWIFPKLDNIITVNKSIASLYNKEYNVEIKVVRNIPPKPDSLKNLSRKELGLPEKKPIILLQGAGINVQRGAEEAIEAMQFINNALFLIIGSGDVIDILHDLVKKLNLNEKVLFLPKQPFNRLIHYTRCADIGVTIDKDTNINYRYSLPNKLFDYINAGIPILASSLVEIKHIVEKYDIGVLIESHDPEHIAMKIKYMLENKKRTAHWKENLKKASLELDWNTEEKVLLKIFSKYA
ncbi:MAG: glycosyltransferase, partial [Bacteroidales bacterium]|nr:glycosyltransferase [Bacteroidales bacterium]